MKMIIFEMIEYKIENEWNYKYKKKWRYNWDEINEWE
jgi:hypothetical protein